MDTLFLTKEARIYSEKRQPLHEVVLEKLDSYMRRLKLEHFLTPYTKTHSKILCGPPPTVMEIKAKVSKGDLLKSFCTTKETIITTTKTYP